MPSPAEQCLDRLYGVFDDMQIAYSSLNAPNLEAIMNPLNVTPEHPIKNSIRNIAETLIQEATVVYGTAYSVVHDTTPLSELDARIEIYKSVLTTSTERYTELSKQQPPNEELVDLMEMMRDFIREAGALPIDHRQTFLAQAEKCRDTLSESQSP